MLAQNSNIKIITRERAIGGTWYKKMLDGNTYKMIITERAMSGTWY